MNYQQTWKTNFPVEAKTQKEGVEGGGEQKAGTVRLKCARGNDGNAYSDILWQYSGACHTFIFVRT